MYSQTKQLLGPFLLYIALSRKLAMKVSYLTQIVNLLQGPFFIVNDTANKPITVFVPGLV
jgi:hypothetical protein